MSRTQAVYYRDPDGDEPVAVFIDGLNDDRAIAKIDDAIEEHLNGKRPDEPPAPDPYTSQVVGELRELRVRFARTRYRVLYQRSGNLMVLLHAIEKNTQRLPQEAIDTAQARMADFKSRMDAAPRKPPRAAGQDAPSKRR